MAGCSFSPILPSNLIYAFFVFMFFLIAVKEPLLNEYSLRDIKSSRLEPKILRSLVNIG